MNTKPRSAMTEEEKEADYNLRVDNLFMRQAPEYGEARSLIHELSYTKDEARKLEIAQELIDLGEYSSLAQQEVLLGLKTPAQFFWGRSDV